ncbi:FAD-binding protein [Bacillus sp. 1P06AnD]|uniref:FAD-dependent oxidoreductase n=1 Tax=Bacillus sp. 1P06AnD TaxID=3132208 RepID=UPI0039A0959E
MGKKNSLFHKPWFIGSLVAALAVMIVWNIPVEKRKYGFNQGGLATDYTGLLPERIQRVEKVNNRYEIQRIIKTANKDQQHVSIAGHQHSQGGHTYYKNGIVLDMAGMNRVLEVNKEKKTVVVESGATWEDVQKAIAPYGLALKVTQSQSIFTVGGSLSVNAHGRDIRFGPMASTVREITLLTPTGEIKKVSYQDKEWLRYVLGGYGLFGVILDVTLDLTDNERYTMHTKRVEAKDYAAYFRHILDDPDVAMHYARISVAPHTFLDEMYAVDYVKTGKKDRTTPLKGEQGIRASKLALDLGRRGGKWEDLFWASQKLYMRSINGKSITRNNAMRSESTFMEFTKPGRVEVLQEFFVPINQFTPYLEALKKELPQNDQNDDFKIHNITVRYAGKDTLTSLPYAREDMLGLVVLLQHGLSDGEILHAKRMIRKWTDVTLDYGGTYYLPYYPYQTKEQFKKAYPDWQAFRQIKNKKDPNEVFVNLFYQNYLKKKVAN